MAGHLGVERVTTQNLRVVQTDVERGLILVEGAVPGVAGGWIYVRDAVKRKLPDDVPMPGKFRGPAAKRLRRRLRPPRPLLRRTRDEDRHHHASTAAAPARSSSTRRSSASSRAPDILQRCVRWQLAKRQAGTHEVKNRSEIDRTTKKIYKQKGTGNARHGAASAPQFRGGGRAFGPVVRSHAHDLPKKVRALALRHALSAKAKDASLIVVDDARARRAKTKALKATASASSGSANALIIAGAEVDANFGRAARNIPNIDVLPVQGINVYDILRRDKLVLTARGRRCAGGALQMSLDPRHYDVILSPVITEKATAALGAQQGRLPRRARTRPSRRSRRRSSGCSTSR